MCNRDGADGANSKLFLVILSDEDKRDFLLFAVWKLFVYSCGYLVFNPLNAELNPICHLLALLEAHHILHVGRIRIKIVVRICGLVIENVTVSQGISHTGIYIKWRESAHR